MAKTLLVIAVLLAVAAGAAQFVPVTRTNPRSGLAIEPPRAIQAVLARSCFDCHSNGTRWPWYAHVAPVSWLVARDVHDGRTNLNFSYWGELTAGERKTKAKKVVDQLASGAMPLRQYLLVHPDARLSSADRELLKDWFSSDAALSPTVASPGSTGAPEPPEPGAWQDEDPLVR